MFIRVVVGYNICLPVRVPSESVGRPYRGEDKARGVQVWVEVGHVEPEEYVRAGTYRAYR